MIHAPRATLCLALAALPVAAQDIYLLVGFAGNLSNAQSKPVTRAIDLDGDGFADGRTELFTFVNRAFSINNSGTPGVDNGSFITDMAVVTENGKPTYYWSDSGDGYIVRGRDLDNDGVIADPEIAIWARWGTTRTFAPDSMAAVRVGNQTVVFAALDSTAPGLHRCVDLNNDGDALDAGENTMFVGPASGLQVQGATGLVSLLANRWTRVRAVADINNVVTVFAYESGSTSRTATINPDDFGYYAFTDVNGVATNPRVFFNPSKINALVQNADIQSGALPDLDIVPPPTTRTARFNNWFQYEIERYAGPGGQDVHWYTNDYGPGRSFGAVNASGTFLHGVVLRGIDQNQDGDLQDAGEVTIFHNGSSNTINGIAPPSFINRATNQPTTDIADFITGLAVVNNNVYFYYNNGGDDAVLELNDLNRNGFTESGEVRMPFFTPRNPYPPVYHATLGPFSLELAVLAEGQVPGPFPAGLVPFGEGCTGSNGVNPVIDARGGSPAIGNQAFTIRGSRMPQYPLGVFLLGTSNTSVFGVPLPLDLSGIGAPGCLLRVNLSFVGFAAGNLAGMCSFPLAIPNDPSLIGASAYTQWLSVDLPANAAGLVASNALQITFQ
jgi:hypothetical protein